MNALVNFLIIAASCIGHTSFWVFLVNRAYSRAINYRLLRWFRMIPESLICIFPVALLTQLFVNDPAFLRGAPIGDVTQVSSLMLLVPLPACLGWLPSILSWHLVRKQRFHHADTRQRLNLVKEASDAAEAGRIRGRGAGVFELWPLNEIYQLEINTKTIALPADHSSSMPVSIRLVHLSDLHFVGCPGEGFYREVVRQALALKPDGFVFTGDLIDDPDLLPIASEILSELAGSVPAWCILGNHDWRYDHDEIRKGLVDAGWVDVSSRTVTAELNGCRVAISGSEMPWLGTDPPAPGECDLAILLSHAPDQLAFARNAGYDVMVSGHTHGGQVVLPVNGPVFSPSRYGARYASGLFEFDDLTLHVSRGLGAKDPVRWNCLPELTCLHIKSAD